MPRALPLTLLAAGLTLASPASAYLLPSAHALRKANGRLRPVHQLQAALLGDVRAADGKSTSVGLRWLFDRARKVARVDINGGGGRQASWARRPGGAPPGAPPAGDARGDPALLPTLAELRVLPRLFADGDAVALAADLQVDQGAQRLTLFAERPALVIGQTAGEHEARELRPQIWLDHETFHVLRVRWRTEGGQEHDIQLTDWEPPPTFGAFPRRIRVLVGGRQVRRFEVDRLSARPPLRGGR